MIKNNNIDVKTTASFFVEKNCTKKKQPKKNKKKLTLTPKDAAKNHKTQKH